IDVVEPGQPPRRPIAPPSGVALPLAPLSAAAAPAGRIAIAGADPRRRGHALTIEGRAGGTFAPLASAGAMAPGVALATAYLGDLALLAPVRNALVLEIQRWFGGAPVGPALD